MKLTRAYHDLIIFSDLLDAEEDNKYPAIPWMWYLF